MDNVQKGILVRSKQGRDKDKIYLVIDVKGDRVYLADGKGRTTKKPKAKNIKHIVPVKKDVFADVLNNLTDEKIACLISTYEQNDN
jgi:ribosomal protein L14E/L6E/L27E